MVMDGLYGLNVFDGYETTDLILFYFNLVLGLRPSEAYFEADESSDYPFVTVLLIYTICGTYHCWETTPSGYIFKLSRKMVKLVDTVAK